MFSLEKDQHCPTTGYNGGLDFNHDMEAGYVSARFKHGIVSKEILYNISNIRIKNVLLILMMIQNCKKYYQFNLKHINILMKFALSHPLKHMVYCSTSE